MYNLIPVGIFAVAAFDTGNVAVECLSLHRSALKHKRARVDGRSRNGIFMYTDTVSASVAPPPRYIINNSADTVSNKTKRKKLKDTTTLGNLVVPSVGIGSISWSSDSVTKLENRELQSLVTAARRSDAAFVDTAERYGSHWKTALGLGYGETESLVRRMLDRAEASPDGPGDASDAVVATKFTPTPWRTTVESVVEACEGSRRRLGVEAIDLYQLHMPDIVQPLRGLGLDRPKDKVYWEGLAECYKRGLVKNVGVSNYGPSLVEECQEALAKKGVPLASNQIGYSLIGRGNGSQTTVDRCDDLGIKVLAYYPFAMGLLTGKYSEDSAGTFADSDRRRSKKTALEMKDLKRYTRGDGTSVPTGGIGPLIRVMKRIANEREKTVAQVALNYVICKGAIPIPGANTVAQLEDNIGSMGWRLTGDEVGILEDEANRLRINFDGAGFKKTNEKFVGYGVERWSLD